VVGILAQEGIMKRIMAVAGTILVMTAGLVLAAGSGGGVKVDLSTVRTVSGTVSSVTMGPGLQHPSFVLAETGGETLAVELGPYWYLVANSFSLAVGDSVTATVANCASRTGSEVVALSVQDLTMGASITLRDENGMPLWKGKHGGRGQAQAKRGGQGGSRCYASGGAVNPSTIQEVSGQVTALSLGLGTHRNTVTLTAQGGGQYVVALGPFWYMQRQGFTLQEGQAVSIRMAQCAQGWVALSVENTATGKVLQLRNDQGVPLWIF